jgi:hypothetical protein
MPRRDGNKKFKQQRRMNHYRYRPGGKIKRRLLKITKFNKNVASLELLNSLEKEVKK